MLALFNAWQYGLAQDVLTQSFYYRMANTMNSSWYRPQFGEFAGLVNGYSGALSRLELD